MAQVVYNLREKHTEKSTMLRHREKDQNKSSKFPSNNLNENTDKKANNRPIHHKRGFKFFKKVAVFVFIIYGVVPLAFYVSPFIRRCFIFAHLVNYPPFFWLSNPEYFGMNHTRHIMLNNDNIKLGVWHILPKSQAKHWKIAPEAVIEEDFNDKRPVFLYLHGHCENRAAGYRLNLYKVLSESKVDGHVVTFDYRGYGDSSGTPTASGVVNDSRTVYSWIRHHVAKKRVIIWGHSLGTAIALKLAKELAREGEHPKAIILESPFNSIREAAQKYPFGAVMNFMPYFRSLIMEPLRHEETSFESDAIIGQIATPILILHSPNDWLVPYHLGRKLYKRALRNRPSNYGPVQFVDIDKTGEIGCGHRWVSWDPNLPNIVIKFLKSLKLKNKIGKKYPV
ncbi:lysophosphatidylserine lipase ABHD12-like isoform X2 [Tachypleus tridentatus]|uniref:lysophosphatidylserine lipase ABHD12-like isoform X2 n=1 Tax=Tachypleus tridentatus TaxID=6853 RepID=UPI003FD37AA8